jgi:hypothetical protein
LLASRAVIDPGTASRLVKKSLVHGASNKSRFRCVVVLQLR